MRKLKRYEDFIIESNLNTNQLNEGYKEILLSLGLLAGVFTGDVSAQTAKEKIKNSANEIENILNDKDKIEDVVADLENLGMKNAAKTISNNAENLLDKLVNFKDKKSRLHEFETSDIKKVVDKLKAGWAISEVTLDTVRKSIESSPVLNNTELSVDSLELNYNPKQLFEAGSFELTDEFKTDFEEILQSIIESGNTVLKINIESSTDKQRVSDELSELLEKLGYSGDNEGLSSARNNVVKDLISNIFEENGDSTVPKIEQVIKFEQGKGQVGSVTPQDPESRYVRVTVYFTEFNDITDLDLDVETDLETAVVIKTIKMKKVTEIDKSRTKSKIKKGSQKVAKGKGSNCPLFN